MGFRTLPKDLLTKINPFYLSVVFFIISTSYCGKPNAKKRLTGDFVPPSEVQEPIEKANNPQAPGTSNAQAAQTAVSKWKLLDTKLDGKIYDIKVQNDKGQLIIVGGSDWDLESNKDPRKSFIATSADSGKTFTVVNDTNRWFYGVECKSDQSCMVAGQYGTIKLTADGGKTWKQFPIVHNGRSSKGAYGGRYVYRPRVVRDRYIAAGTDAEIFYQDDTAEHFNDFDHNDHATDGDRKACRKSEANLTAEKAKAPTDQSAELLKKYEDEVKSCDSAEGVAWMGADWRTRYVYPEFEKDFLTLTPLDMSCPTGADVCFGIKGTTLMIFQFDEKGIPKSYLRSWKPGTVCEPDAKGNCSGVDIPSIHFVSKDVGWVINYQGFVGKTTDGGNTFTKVLKTPVQLQKVFALSEQIAWVVGEKGNIWKTTDGGVTWANEIYGTEIDRVTAIYFYDENHGYLGGLNGKIMYFGP